LSPHAIHEVLPSDINRRSLFSERLPALDMKHVISLRLLSLELAIQLLRQLAQGLRNDNRIGFIRSFKLTQILRQGGKLFLRMGTNRFQ